MSVALVALLLLLSWLAATISGAAGFGGALLLLPALTYALGVKTAVPVLTIMQLLGNLSRVWFGRADVRWRAAGVFLAPAVPAALLGSLLFAWLPGPLIKAGIGALLLAIVAARRLGWGLARTGRRELLLGGLLTGFVSGVAGSAGPLGAAVFLGLGLPPAAYVASEAATAVAMHLTKSLVYSQTAHVGAAELRYGLLFGAAMVLGSWTGRRVVERLPRERFRALVEALLVVSAVQLILAA